MLCHLQVRYLGRRSCFPCAVTVIGCFRKVFGRGKGYLPCRPLVGKGFARRLVMEGSLHTVGLADKQVLEVYLVLNRACPVRNSAVDTLHAVGRVGLAGHVMDGL